MSDKLTYGATREVLQINGYVGTSLQAPGSFGYRVADHDAGLLLMNDATCGLEDWSARRVVALTICARTAKVRAAIFELLKKHKLNGGISRTASDGSIAFILRYDGYGNCISQASEPAHSESDPALSLDAALRIDPMGKSPAPLAVRLDGEWTKNASPLTVPRASLPRYEDQEALWIDVRDVLSAHAPKVETSWGIPTRPAKKKPEEGEPSMLEQFIYRPQGFLPNEDNRKRFHIPDPAKGRNGREA